MSINENKNIQMSQIDKPKASTYAKNIRPLLKKLMTTLKKPIKKTK